MKRHLITELQFKSVHLLILDQFGIDSVTMPPGFLFPTAATKSFDFAPDSHLASSSSQDESYDDEHRGEGEREREESFEL